MKYFLTDGGGHWVKEPCTSLDKAVKDCQLTDLLYIVPLTDIKKDEQLRLVTIVAQNQALN